MIFAFRVSDIPNTLATSGYRIPTVDGSEIRPSLVEVGDLSHHFQEFSKIVVQDLFKRREVYGKTLVI